ncbi:MAG: tetratricopeptide repeat protein [Gemmatimonadales bacterium]|nr:tetratricopeptide repeat protein [Gemmatimonadales bacterium]
MVTTPPADDLPRELRELVASGRFREALELHQRADRIAAQRPEAQLLAATAATRVGNLGAAEPLAAEAHEGFRARADHDGRMRALNLLGAIAFEHGQLPKAEQHFHQVMLLARELDDQLMVARVANNPGSVAIYQQPHHVALSLYRSALLAYQRLGDRRGAAETYYNLAVIFREMSEWHDAADATGEAIRHAGLVGEPSLMALALMGRIETNIERGELALARRDLERCALLVARSGDDFNQIDLARLRGLAALREGDFVTAYAEGEAARRKADRTESVLQKAEAAALVARALSGMGRLREAEAARAGALGLFQELGADNLAERFERTWQAE